MTWALLGDKVWNFLKQVPIWVWIVIVAAITLKWVEADNFKKGGEAKADEIKEKQAEVKAAVVERRAEIITEERQNADAALDARDSAEHYPTYDSLPDDLKRIANGNQGSGSGS